jgi:putative transcriptional regulator
MHSLRGHLLVAAPNLRDANFYRTVVLIIRHDEDGAVGLVLNRPTNSTVREIWTMIVEAPCDISGPVHWGGPVAGPLMALHANQACSESELVPGVHFATHKDQLNRIVREAEQPSRIFSGYSGWAAGQLERELKVGGWMSLKATYDFVFGEADMLWKNASQAIGEQITRALLEKSRLPAEPSRN